jgi:hypothetical protein
MHSNQSWPPVISPLGVYPCFRNAMRAKQGCCRDWQGHTVFVSICFGCLDVKEIEKNHVTSRIGRKHESPSILIPTRKAVQLRGLN